MKRTAVFVDAGYLYAQGSACVHGSKVKRESLELRHADFITHIRTLSAAVQPLAPLLRIYWYDGTSRGPTQDHRILASLDDVKLRLGFINSSGQQKGVDSLLVTDLVELSRNGAICDALLLGGDEDLRIGVQIAQSFGVRVHLIGIEPSTGSQSLQLRQEADTKHEISSGEIKMFLAVIATTTPAPVLVLPALAAATQAPVLPAAYELNALESLLDTAIEAVLVKLDSAQLLEISEALTRTRSVPSLYDRRILASCRTALGRDLIMDEKKQMRVRLSSAVALKLSRP